MPSLTFVLPHWLYWSGLVVFPLVAMIMARRTDPENRHRGYSLGFGYLALATGGILGLHRFYLRSLLGLVYLPIFLFILFSNAEQRDARSAYSDAANLVKVAQDTLNREEPRLEQTKAGLSAMKAEVDAAEEGSFSRRSAEKRLERAEKSMATSAERINRAQEDLSKMKPVAEEARASRAFWGQAAFYAFMVILALMLIDAVMLPSLKRKADEKARLEDEADTELAIEAHEEEEEKDDIRHVSTGWTGVIDRLSLVTGEFVSYWAVIAVFVYYYEVIARYVFNSPTNWAHEGMFLMFGMQYLISGAYAMLCESHVRVDVFYAPMSRRRKAIVDILTSVFFFIFAGVLLVTGWIFAWQATDVDEVSFTEWGIAYWPFKWAIAIGAFLILLQGISKIAQDFRVLVAGEAEA
jgi:TRAP-type mannitol/chloroaromatic compound transport system permease small subunit